MSPVFALEAIFESWVVVPVPQLSRPERSLPLQKMVVFVCLLMLVLIVPVVSVAQSSAQTDNVGTPTFTTDSSLTTVPATSKTVPHWTSSFTYQGVTYPYTMVGTNPATNSTTTVDVAIIPFDFVFANGDSLDATTKVSNVLGSPNFQDATYTSGTTQYGDAVQRAEFWPAVSTSSPAWHTLINPAPTVYPTQVIQVPQNQATLLVGRVSHRLLALMSASWFSDRLHEAINNLHISSTTLPIILTYDTFLYVHSLNNCCILGYHGAFPSVNGNGNQQIQTFAFAAWTDPNIFPPGWADVLPLSHEISEWMNDPFIHNFVPPWQFPGIPGSCQGNLETGDPMEVLPHPDFPVTINGFTYHPQTEAILPWFAREVPSSAIGGAYSYPDASKLTGPSQPCQ
jgi:hypothetical protein